SKFRRRRSSRSFRSATNDQPGAKQPVGGARCSFADGRRGAPVGQSPTSALKKTMNFPLILFLATSLTGVVALADRLYLAKSRSSGAREPWWVEYPKSFFPVLLIVFLLRSFVAEPFKIPSSSMRPTLDVGDFIPVNKFAYGMRLPIIEKKIIPTREPQRGDVIVFRYPVNPSQDFIKRVIGLPGDQVVYLDKKLTVNGVPLPQTADGTYGYLE